MQSEKMRIEIIETDEALIAIKDEWEAFSEKITTPHFYATFSFISTTWKYYGTGNDQLFILVVKKDTTLVGIAPFKIETVKVGHFRLLRIIHFIAQYGCGDKPSIITTEKPEDIWNEIFQFLSTEYTQWDGIQLVEQPENSPVLNQTFFPDTGYYLRSVPRIVSYYVSITGTWEEYFKTRDKKTQLNWKQARKIFKIPEGVFFQCIEDPKTLPEALERYIRIEQSGWKKNLDFSVGGNQKNEKFYEELLINLAPKKLVAIYFLRSAATDIAGAIVFKHKSILYLAQATYCPIYAKYSPGLILMTEIIKNLFGTQYRECDLLGFRAREKNSFKTKWSTGTLQTITIEIYKKTLFVHLYMMGKQLKIFLNRFKK